MKLSIVTPTYNEADNVERFAAAVGISLMGLDYEIVFVDDDSPDLTWEKAQRLAENDSRIRVLRRTADRGLSASVVHGFTAARGDVVACIDCDLQHDPAILPNLLQAIEQGAELAVGCRYMDGGGTGNWGLIRRLESEFATKLAQSLLRVKLRDPMSGYFMLRRDDFLQVRDNLDCQGFKILLEISARMQPEKVAEVPYTFQARVAGESKLSSKVVWEYLQQIWRLSRLGAILPVRFLQFGIVGASGVLVNLLALASLVYFQDVKGWKASAGACLVATISNYILNNVWTFRDRAHKGISFAGGYVSYLIIALLGIMITSGAYSALTSIRTKLSGTALNIFELLTCQFLAVLAGTYSNYKLNKSITWRPVGPVVTEDLHQRGE